MRHLILLHSLVVTLTPIFALQGVRLERTLGSPRPTVTRGSVTSTAFSPDGSILAVLDGDALVTLWKMGAGDGTVLENISFGRAGWDAVSSQVLINERFVVATNGREVKVFDRRSKEVRPFPFDFEGLGAVYWVVSRDGSTLVVAKGASLHCFDFATLRLRRSMPGYFYDLAVSHDGKFLGGLSKRAEAGRATRYFLDVLALETGQNLAQIELPDSPSHLLLPSTEERVAVWVGESRQTLFRYDWGKRELRTIRRTSGHPILSMDLSLVAFVPRRSWVDS
jgi:WD40 repeat protein